MIQSGALDAIVSIGSNFFYTVTLPCTLWFFDKGKRHGKRKDTILFLDARPYFKQVTRAIREFTPEQMEFFANIVRLYRGEKPEYETAAASKAILKEKFAKSKYEDVAGLCKAATLAEIESQGWSLNPGRYVGVGELATDEFNFAERLVELNEEYQSLTAEAMTLHESITANVNALVEGGK